MNNERRTGFRVGYRCSRRSTLALPLRSVAILFETVQCILASQAGKPFEPRLAEALLMYHAFSLFPRESLDTVLGRTIQCTSSHEGSLSARVAVSGRVGVSLSYRCCVHCCQMACTWYHIMWMMHVKANRCAVD